MAGHSVASRVILGLLSAASLAFLIPAIEGRNMDVVKKASTESTPAKDGELQGSSIVVLTNSEGVTEVYIGKPNITEGDIANFISAILHPFSRSKRSYPATPIALATPLAPPLAPPVAPAYYSDPLPPPLARIDLAKDSLILVAPALQEAPISASKDAGGMDHVAYVLPKGLSSLPRELKEKLLTPNMGMKKIALLMFPPEVDFMGITGRQPSNRLFPLDHVKIREIKIVDGETDSARLVDVMDYLSFSMAGIKGLPWLILREVKIAKDVVDGVDAQSKGRTTRSLAEESADLDSNVVGTIYVSKDGALTWQLTPNVPQFTRVPIVPFPSIPQIPAVPFPPLPPVPQPLQFPWFNRIPPPNPFYMPFIPPIPYWNSPAFNPNPFGWALPVR